jgi:hypothetical protein
LGSALSHDSRRDEVVNAELSAREVGVALQAALKAVVHACPGGMSSVSELSRQLGLGRAICQRVVLCTRASTGDEALLRVPGVRGIEMFIENAAQVGVTKSLLNRAREALKLYEKLVSDAGGSQSRLLKNLGRSGSVGSPASSTRVAMRQVNGEAARKLIWQGMSGITGQRCEAMGMIEIIRPLPHDPDSVEILGASMFVGLECTADAMPVIRNLNVTEVGGNNRPESAPRASSAFSSRPDGLIEAFSDAEIPSAGTRTGNGNILQILNLVGQTSAPLNVAIGHWFSPAGPHPKMGEKPYRLNIGKICTVPTQAMVLDIYLERSMAASCVPEVKGIRTGHRGGLRIPEQLEDRWFDAIPEDLDLVLLGRGATRRSPLAIPRLTELTNFIFAESHLNADQFVGYRLEVSYPIPEVSYVVSFDFDV